MWKSKLISAALPLALLALILGAAAPRELKWKSADHKKVGAKIADYYEAKDKKSGFNETLEQLTKAIDKVAKKHKDQDILSFTEDWEQVLYLATLESYKEKPKAKGRIFEVETEDSAGNPLPLAVHFPKSYSTKGPALPLVLVIPDEGEDPKTHLQEDWVDPTGLESAILVAIGMPEDTASWAELDVDKPSGIGSVMSAFGYIKGLYAVDLDRTYLAGSGKGTIAALATACASPHWFAGVVSRGAAPEWTQVTNFRIVPSLFVSGGTHATGFSEALKGAGGDNCTLASGGTEADIWAWIGAQVRQPYPLDFAFTPFTPYMKNCSWVTVDGFDPTQNPRVEVKVDRAANQITVTAENIASLRLYLNDVIVDLEEPVKVIINGTEHEQQCERQRKLVTDLCYNWGDWGRVFSATAAFDVQ